MTMEEFDCDHLLPAPGPCDTLVVHDVRKADLC